MKSLREMLLKVIEDPKNIPITQDELISVFESGRISKSFLGYEFKIGDRLGTCFLITKEVTSDSIREVTMMIFAECEIDHICGNYEVRKEDEDHYHEDYPTNIFLSKKESV